MPRSAGDAAAELHALLAAAGVEPPYVLVGHSTGGLIARLYARARPGAIAGLVLVDAIPETMQSGMKPRQFARYERRYLNDVPPTLAGYADLESIDFRRSFAQMRRAPRPRRALPAIVLSKTRPWGRPPGVSRGFAVFVDRVWENGQDHLARLFADDPHWVAKRSGHLIHSDQPGLVTRAIARVLRRARGPGSA
jgi:pimeloyl-ACP methyl ester carboxylesterase